MPKKSQTRTTPAKETLEFGARLVAALASAGQPRRGAGTYLSKRYGVSTVTANAWLNGEHKPEIWRAQIIADDHGTDFSELYFGKTRTPARRLKTPPSVYGDTPPDSEGARGVTVMTVNEREEALVEMYRELGDTGRGILESMAEALLRRDET